jgi:hypothetical protein
MEICIRFYVVDEIGKGRETYLAEVNALIEEIRKRFNVMSIVEMSVKA